MPAHRLSEPKKQELIFTHTSLTAEGQCQNTLTRRETYDVGFSTDDNIWMGKCYWCDTDVTGAYQDVVIS